jgi:hypothetical protein
MQIHESRPSDSYAENDGIKRAYDSLSERGRLIGKLLNQAQSLRGLPSYDSADLLIKISDFAPVLDEIPDWALSESFKLAVKIHDYRQPFQVSEIIMAWRTLSESRKEALYNGHRRKTLPPGPPCEWCGGYGWTRILEDGTPVKFHSTEDTNRVVVCDCRRQVA